MVFAKYFRKTLRAFAQKDKFKTACRMKDLAGCFYFLTFARFKPVRILEQ